MPANEIIEGIWIGDVQDAKTWEGDILCVLEQRPADEPEKAVWFPVLSNGVALKSQLDAIAVYLSVYPYSQLKPILVHCGAGVERSPLVVAWFLKWDEYNMIDTLDKAYDLIASKRPQIERRKEWIKGGETG